MRLQEIDVPGAEALYDGPVPGMDRILRIMSSSQFFKGQLAAAGGGRSLNHIRK